MILHKGHMWNVFTFSQRLLGLVAMPTISNVTLCLQKTSKFIAETNVQKANIKLKSKDSGERSGPNGPLVLLSFGVMDLDSRIREKGVGG